MCDKGCSDTEECRYDKENCEFKCYAITNSSTRFTSSTIGSTTTTTTTTTSSSTIMIWAPITAIAGIITIGLLAFFVVRHVRNKAKMRSTIRKEIQQDYELPYNLTVDHWDPKTLVRKCHKVSDRKKWLCSSCSAHSN